MSKIIPTIIPIIVGTIILMGSNREWISFLIVSSIIMGCYYFVETRE